ncbi:restriction endonuclease subunit S [Streptococcus parasanguinis]|uniref:restriction endonuclease subunit S n=1 Tax=Streptococcus parasanguinis TaxID=1318 RepID=UPI0034A2F276
MNQHNNPKIRFKGYDNSLEKKTIGDITTSFSGGTPKSSNKTYYEGNIPFIRSGEIKTKQTELFISDEALKNSSAKMVEKGDILYALYGATSGEVAISQINGAINQAILAIKPNSGYSSEFIMNYLKKEKENILEKYLQGGQGNLSAAIVKSIELSLPSQDEQSTIGSLFRILDDLLASYKDNLANHQSLKTTMLSKMFPKAGQTVPEIRLNGFEGEWEKVKLKDVTESIEYGLNASAKEFDGENKYIRITDIDDVSRKFKEDSITSPDINVSECDNYLLCEKDILFARTGASVGKTYLYDIKDGKVYFAGFLIRARIKEKFDSKFIFQNTLTDRFTQYVKVTSQRSGQPGVNGKEYGEYELYIPICEEQQAIGSYFANLDNLITSYQEKISQLEILKTKLLQDMFI